MTTRWMSLGATFIFLMIAGTLQVSTAQSSRERLIHRMPLEQNEPIEITDIKVNDQSVSFDKKFTADDEWLSSLVISIKNKSNKPILYASIRLQFPRLSGSKEPFSIFDLSTGNAGLLYRPPTAEERAVGISPIKPAEMKLSPERFKVLRDFLSMTQYPYGIEKVDLSIDRVIFEDDTMWYGKEFRRDPKDPTSWIPSRPSDSKTR